MLRSGAHGENVLDVVAALREEKCALAAACEGRGVGVRGEKIEHGNHAVVLALRGARRRGARRRVDALQRIEKEEDARRRAVRVLRQAVAIDAIDARFNAERCEIDADVQQRSHRALRRLVAREDDVPRPFAPDERCFPLLRDAADGVHEERASGFADGEALHCEGLGRPARINGPHRHLDLVIPYSDQVRKLAVVRRDREQLLPCEDRVVVRRVAGTRFSGDAALAAAHDVGKYTRARPRPRLRDHRRGCRRRARRGRRRVKPPAQLREPLLELRFVLRAQNTLLARLTLRVARDELDRQRRRRRRVRRHHRAVRTELEVGLSRQRSIAGRCHVRLPLFVAARHEEPLAREDEGSRLPLPQHPAFLQQRAVVQRQIHRSANAQAPRRQSTPAVVCSSKSLFTFTRASGRGGPSLDDDRAHSIVEYTRYHSSTVPLAAARRVGDWLRVGSYWDRSTACPQQRGCRGGPNSTTVRLRSCFGWRRRTAATSRRLSYGAVGK